MLKVDGSRCGGGVLMNSPNGSLCGNTPPPGQQTRVKGGSLFSKGARDGAWSWLPIEQRRHSQGGSLFGKRGHGRASPLRATAHSLAGQGTAGQTQCELWLTIWQRGRDGAIQPNPPHGPRPAVAKWMRPDDARGRGGEWEWEGMGWDRDALGSIGMGKG